MIETLSFIIIDRRPKGDLVKGKITLYKKQEENYEKIINFFCYWVFIYYDD